MTEYNIVLCTIDNVENAKKTAKILVGERLCACVNIIPQVCSIYRWKDNIEQDDEILMIIKSKKNLYNQLEQRIKEFHPYDVPEIISMDINQGSERYLQWLGGNTV